MITEGNEPILSQFVRESTNRVQQLAPLVRQLVGEPDREGLRQRVIDESHRLFHSLLGSGAVLQLEYLLGPAEAMAHLLSKLRSTALALAPRHIALLAETCTFVEQGLALVARERHDQRLAAAAASLQNAILALAQQDDEQSQQQAPLLGISVEMRSAFMEECDHLLMTAEQECVLWDFIAVDHQRVAELCQVLHRLKQNFALYECDDFQRLCMALESTLNRYLQGEFFQTEYPERVFLRCIDAMREGLSRYPLTEQMVVCDAQNHLHAVRALIRQPLGALLIEAGLVDPCTVDEALSVQRSSCGGHAPLLGEVLVAMGEVSREQVEQVLKAQQHESAVFAVHCSGDVTPPPMAAHSMVPLFPQEVRIDGQKLSRMVSLVRQMSALSLPGKLVPYLTELGSLLRNCTLESSRGLLHFCQRMVHDEAMQRHKRILFQAEGLESLHDALDAGFCAELILPLLRNAVEHGVEDGEQRQAAGKKKTGRVALTALRQGDEYWISVEDDGQGIDLQAIARLCCAQGLVGREELDRVTGAELLQVFLNNQRSCATPDHSSSIPASPTVLRRTGLAAVKSRLGDIHGKMDIWSRPRKGTRITLRLPRSC